MRPLSLTSLSAADDAMTNERRREIQLQQTSVFTTFCAKRNSGRIRRYFIRSKSDLWKSALITIVILAIMVCLTVNFWLSDYIVRNNCNVISTATMGFLEQRMSNCLMTLFTDLYVYSSAFSSVFPSENPMLTMNLINAARITSFTAMFSSISQANVSWWDLGRSDGMYIGMVSRLTNPAKGAAEKLLYCEEQNGDLYGWRVDASGTNNTYPWQGGDLIMKYDVSARTWFANAIAKKAPTCMDLYPETTAGEIGKNTPWFACSSPGVGEAMVVALGTPLSGIQAWLESHAAMSDSKLALIRESDNMVMGIVGTDAPFDEYDNALFLKSQDQLTDPTWRAVLDSKSEWFAQAEEESLVRKTFQVNGEDTVLNVRIGKISLFGEGEMTLYMVFDDRRSIASGNLLQTSVIVLFFVIGLVMIGLLGAIYLIMSKWTLKKKSKIVEVSAKRYNIEEFGVRQVPILLEHLRYSHADNPHIVSVVREAENMLAHSGDDLYFNGTSFYASISDERVRQKFQSIYGPCHYREKKVETSEKFLTDTQSNFALLMLDSWSESFNIPVPEDDDENIKCSITALLSKYNEHRIMFNCDEFRDFIERIFVRIDRRYYPLLYHSIAFSDFYLGRRISSILPDSDHALALMLIIVMWHVEMSDIRNQAIFLPDDLSFTNTVKGFLLDLFDALAISGSAIGDRWDQFVTRINALRAHASISHIGYFFAYTSLFAKHVTRLETETEATMVMGTLFVASMFSFLFCDSDSSQVDPVHMDLESYDKEETQFARRLRDVLFEQAKELLADLCPSSTDTTSIMTFGY